MEEEEEEEAGGGEEEVWKRKGIFQKKECAFRKKSWFFKLAWEWCKGVFGCLK